MLRNVCLRLVQGAVVILLCVSSARGAPLLIDSPPPDTFGVGPVFLDITSYGAVTDLVLGNTTFTVNFASAISPPHDFAGNSVVGFIDIDTDKTNAAVVTGTWGLPLVGGNNWINFFIPPNPGSLSTPVPGPLIALGDEFFVDLFSEAFNLSMVDVIDTNTNAVAFTVPITFNSTGFSVTVPLIGTTGNGSLDFGLLMGTFVEPTDRAPNGASPATSVVPEPSSLLLFGICAFVLLGSGWWVRP
jgi:PEP-CTERM motif